MAENSLPYYRCPEYVSWRKMKERCLYPKHPYYANYGGRGIRICSEWLASFENFQRDMGTRPVGTTLERIDSDGPYCKSNCRWATRQEQARNRRVRTIDKQHIHAKISATGFRGVRQIPDNTGENGGRRWRAYFRNKYLGSFFTPEEAARAWNEAVRKAYGPNAVVNDV